MFTMPDAWYERVNRIAGKPAQEVNDIPELVSLYAALRTDATRNPKNEADVIMELLRRIGQPAIAALLPFVRAETPEMRAAALYLLTVPQQPDNAAIAEAARAALNDENEEVRERALATLTFAAGEEDLELVLDNIQPGSWTTHHVLGLLNRIGSNKAIPGLMRLLNLEGSSVDRRFVIEALERINTPEAIKAVEEWQASPTGRDYIETLITTRIDRLRAGRLFWRADLILRQPPGERFTLEQFALFQTLLRMLDMPDLAEKAIDMLRQLDHPEAKQVLRERGLDSA